MRKKTISVSLDPQADVDLKGFQGPKKPTEPQSGFLEDPGGLRSTENLTLYNNRNI